ncbi:MULTISPECIES: hypothetical protein [Bradyrhizobium]|uniref:Class IIb bacteriocin, lactobin A/cerein 7B family n=1 Tax=Bradyrhizobium ottawaense TaxID=931866 RepID=A0ABV4FHY8_9BRAD|nr:hypothetical protein [Bradyrhizobium sp. CCBAU 15615]
MKVDISAYDVTELTAGEAVATSGGWVLGLFAAVVATMFAAVAAWEIGR